MLGLLVIPFAFLPLLADRRDFAASPAFGPAPTGSKEAATIIYFALLAFLYVGMEASVGNWMSTYATRATAWSFAGGSLALTVFWAALLLGRAITPAMLGFLTERRLYRACVIATIAGISLLLAAHNPPVLLVGSALTGLALAPLFPLILSLFLKEIGESRNAGWVFAVAGLGGAVLSWLTGTVSSGTGSLRIGLMVPGAAALMMMALISWRRTNQETQTTAAPAGIHPPAHDHRQNLRIPREHSLPQTTAGKWRGSCVLARRLAHALLPRVQAWEALRARKGPRTLPEPA